MTSAILLIALLLVGVFFVIYKRQMLIKMFSINIATMADEFRSEMGSTADLAVKKLEHQMAQLEYLLEEADAKILTLETRLRNADEKLKQLDGTVRSAANASPPFSSVAVTGYQHSIQSDTPIADVQRSPVSQSSQPLRQASSSEWQDIAQSKRQQVVAMHQQGYTVVEIAKSTGMGKGEVMLLLELHKS